MSDHKVGRLRLFRNFFSKTTLREMGKGRNCL